jgi:hypothetical protein
VAIAIEPIAAERLPRYEQFSINVSSPMSRYISTPTDGRARCLFDRPLRSRQSKMRRIYYGFHVYRIR